MQITIKQMESDAEIRGAATLWLAKFRYNRREWKAAGKLFAACAESETDDARAAEALKRGLRPALWLAVPGALLAGLIGALAGGKKAGGGFSFS